MKNNKKNYFLIDSTLIFSEVLINKSKNIYEISFDIKNVDDDITLSSDSKSNNDSTIYKWIEKGKRIVTSQPNPEYINSLITNIFKINNVNSLLIYCINKKFSGTYNTLVKSIENLPKKMCEKTTIIQCKNYLLSGLIDFLELYKLKINSALDYINHFKKINVKDTFGGVVTDYKMLKKSGRFNSGLYSVILTKCNIKICLKISNKNKNIVELLSIKRSFKGAVISFFNLYKKKLANNPNCIFVIYYTIFKIETIEKIKNIINILNNNLKVKVVKIPVIYASLLGEQYAFDVFNLEEQKIIHEYIN